MPDQIEHAHTLDGHAANLVALVRKLDLARLTVVCHDWGGPTGLAMTLSKQARIRDLVVMSTWALPLPPAEFHTRVFPWLNMHASLVGPYLLGRGAGRPGRLPFGRRPVKVSDGPGSGRAGSELRDRRCASISKPSGISHTACSR